MTYTLDWAYWIDGSGAFMVTGSGDYLVFGSLGAAEIEGLTSPPSQLSITSPKRRQYTSSLSVTLTAIENWVDSTADGMVDSDGNVLVFSDVVSGSAMPIALTAPPTDSALEAG